MITQRAAVLPTSYSIILAVSGTHLINDLIQFLLPALYPLLKSQYALSYFQIGLLTLAQQITACVLQPILGLYGDLRPKPYSLAVSMAVVAHRRRAAGDGEFLRRCCSRRLFSASARRCSTPRPRAWPHGLGWPARLRAIQLPGRRQRGTALGPLAAALIVLPLGQASTVWFGLLAVCGIMILSVDRALVRASDANGPAAGVRQPVGPELPRSGSSSLSRSSGRCCSASSSISRPSRATTPSS